MRQLKTAVIVTRSIQNEEFVYKVWFFNPLGNKVSLVRFKIFDNKQFISCHYVY